MKERERESWLLTYRFARCSVLSPQYVLGYDRTCDHCPSPRANCEPPVLAQSSGFLQDKMMVRNGWIGITYLKRKLLPSHFGDASLQTPDSRQTRLGTPLSLCDCVQLKVTSEPTYVVFCVYFMEPYGMGVIMPQSISEKVLCHKRMYMTLFGI